MIFIRRLPHILMILFVSYAQAANIKKIEEGLSDTVITTKIKTQFTKNKNLNPLKISVTTNHGVVTLKGHAKNKMAYVDTLRIVTNTKGVRTINTTEFDVNVVNSAFKDTYITAKVETAILKSKVLDDESIPLVGINVATVNGIVTISGIVRHEAAMAAILKRTNHVHGVKKIISHLEVVSNEQRIGDKH